jgi:hypothetical protein
VLECVREDPSEESHYFPIKSHYFPIKSNSTQRLDDSKRCVSEQGN